MRKIRKRGSGFTFTQLATTVAIIILLATLATPILVRIMNNIKDEAVIATLYSLLEAQKSYRDAQTPATYANNLTALISGGYIVDVTNRYRYTFRVATATPDTFEVQAIRADGSNSGYAIDQNGTVSVITPPAPPPPVPPPPVPPGPPPGDGGGMGGG